MDPLDLDGQLAARDELIARERLAAEEARADLRRILSSEHGRRFVMRLLESARIYSVSFDPSASESTHLTAFNEGRRNEGLKLFAQIQECCSDLWPVMVRERNEAKKANESTHRNG